MFRFYFPFRENIYTYLSSQRGAASIWAEDTAPHRVWVICESESAFPHPFSSRIKLIYWIFLQSSVKEKMCSYIMGIDIGTTSVKVCLINSSNREVIHKNIKVGKFEYGTLICNLLKDENYNTHFGLKRPNSCRCLNLRHSFRKILGYIQRLRNSSKLSYSNFKVNW